MRPEDTAMAGGDTVEDELPFNVLSICCAYESGFGHAHRDLCNPYVEGSDEWHAYAYGKSEGEERTPETSVECEQEKP